MSAAPTPPPLHECDDCERAIRSGEVTNVGIFVYHWDCAFRVAVDAAQNPHEYSVTERRDAADVLYLAAHRLRGILPEERPVPVSHRTTVLCLCYRNTSAPDPGCQQCGGSGEVEVDEGSLSLASSLAAAAWRDER